MGGTRTVQQALSAACSVQLTTGGGEDGKAEELWPMGHRTLGRPIL